MNIQDLLEDNLLQFGQKNISSVPGSDEPELILMTPLTWSLLCQKVEKDGTTYINLHFQTESEHLKYRGIVVKRCLDMCDNEFILCQKVL